MKIELKIAGYGDEKLWDDIVQSSIQGSIFHTFKWLKIAEKSVNFTFYPLIGYNGMTPVVIIPIFFKKKMLLRMVFSPPPHLGMLYLGPVFSDYQNLKQDKKEIYYEEFRKSLDIFIAEKFKANYISIFLPPYLTDPRPFKWAGYSVEPAYDYQIDLSCGTDCLWQNLKKNARSDINKSLKRGVQVEKGYIHELEAIYNLLIDRYENQDKQVTVSKKYILDIYDSFSDNIKIIVAKYEGRIITGSIKLLFKDEELSWIGSPKPAIYISPSPNPLLSWEEIKSASESQMKTYVQLGTAGNKRLHLYFSKFNPDLRIRFNVKKATLSARIFEKIYICLVKPFMGKIRFHRKD